MHNSSTVGYYLAKRCIFISSGVVFLIRKKTNSPATDNNGQKSTLILAIIQFFYIADQPHYTAKLTSFLTAFYFSPHSP